MSDAPYTDQEGWTKAGVSRQRLNPNYSIFNFLWVPKYLTQEQFLKVWQDRGLTKLLVKWVSTHPRYKVEESDD